jgi:hypothetical protein
LFDPRYRRARPEGIFWLVHRVLRRRLWKAASFSGAVIRILI